MVTRFSAVHSFTYVAECHRYFKDLLLLFLWQYAEEFIIYT
jgi:hypothetical protein